MKDTAEFVVKIENLKDRWCSSHNYLNGASIFVRSKAFYGGKFINSQSLADKLLEVFESIDRNDFKKLITEVVSGLNGFFSIIYKRDDLCLGIVDRVRSIPLFYSKADNFFQIADDPHALMDPNSEFGFYAQSSTEFLLTGYVTGDETLHEDIFQIRPGEFVIAEKKSNGKIELSQVSYFTYFSDMNLDWDDEALEEELNKRMEKVFDRYSSFLHSRNLFVPLSGGLDSRLIVAMFKKAGMEKITCFTYGNPKSEDAVLSYKVANSLGYNWRFFPYRGRPFWANLANDHLLDCFISFASAYSSIAHPQDWPAARHLISVLGDLDPVFVPGHTGDFLSGGHVPWEIMRENGNENLADLVANSIFSHHYNLWPLPQMCDDLRQDLLDRIKRSFFTYPRDRNSAVKCYEQWEWAGRQAKFIINSVRVYDFFRKDWVLPLWDNDLMDFFVKLGASEKYQKRIYINTLCRKVFCGRLSKLQSIPVSSTTKLIYQRRGAIPKKVTKEKILGTILKTRGLNCFPIMLRNWRRDVFNIYGYFSNQKSMVYPFKPRNLSKVPQIRNLPFMRVMAPNLHKPLLMHSLNGLFSAQYLLNICCG
jgi:asparagine synthase (glutamine-hydrolysing)